MFKVEEGGGLALVGAGAGGLACVRVEGRDAEVKVEYHYSVLSRTASKLPCGADLVISQLLQSPSLLTQALTKHISTDDVNDEQTI